MRHVSSLSRAGEAISLLQLHGYGEVTDWGPSMPIAKLQAQSQTYTRYSLQQERQPTCQRTFLQSLGDALSGHHP